MLTIVSWNIQYGKGVDGRIDLHRIADVVKQDGLPEVLCLQEVSRNDPETANGSDQLSELQKLFPNYEIFYGASQNRSGGKDGGRRQFGNLILTRRSPLQVLHHLLPSPADPKARFMSRQTTEIVISTDSGALRLMNTHLEFFSEKQQLAQVQRIRDLHEEACAQTRESGLDFPNTPFARIQRPENMVICGDFNFVSESASYRLITSAFPEHVPDLVDAWDVVHPENNRSPTCGIFDHKQWKEGPHCRDYFFISQNLSPQVNQVSVNTETASSDHQPIRITFEE
jgi:endonuclease/exonuclease/phosphatase family metal-dependent hydrolase